MENIDFVKKLMNELSDPNFMMESGYAINKKTIKDIFKLTQDKKVSKDNIHARLTVIDSMYSTQMNKRYYALEGLAKELYNLQKTYELPLAEQFRKFAIDPTDEGILNIFNKQYGIGKDGKDKGLAVSLLSKYAYYDTNFQFPIYDSIVRERYAGFWIYCDFDKTEIPQIHKNKIDIKTFIKAINKLLKNLNYTNIPQRYDVLDRLLWVVGKIIRGNLSLILSENEYVELVSENEYVELVEKLNEKQEQNEDAENNRQIVFQNYKKKLLNVVKTDALKQLIELAEQLYIIEKQKNIMTKNKQ